MIEYTPEMIAEARSAASDEELLEMAKNKGIEMSQEEAVALYAKLNPVDGEIADDELEAVAGGCNDGTCNAQCGSLCASHTGSGSVGK